MTGREIVSEALHHNVSVGLQQGRVPCPRQAAGFTWQTIRSHSLDLDATTGKAQANDYTHTLDMHAIR